MSVVTTRTSILSILKINRESKLSPSPRVVRFQLPGDVRRIFLDKKKSINTKDYDKLVVTIRDSEINDTDLRKLLEEAKSCVGLLDYDLRLFVQALVILGWTHRSDKVIEAYQDFIQNVVSAHPLHAKDVIEQLVKNFNNFEGAVWIDGVPNDEDKKHFGKIHEILKRMIKTIPLTTDMLLSSLRHYFPYQSVDPQKQLTYMYNVLKTIEYLPSYRRDILQMLVDRLVTLDVHAPREDMMEPTDEQFPIDDVTTYSPEAEALDSGMLLMFRYFETVTGAANGELKWMDTKALFSDLLEVMEKSILTCNGSNHVQFLYFYFVSLKTTLAQSFLNFLWQKVLSPTVPTVVRKLAISHIASFLARSNFIPSGFLKTYLSEMSTWVHRYINNQDSISRPTKEIRAHSVFYSVCQAIFYVIAFRHRDLVDSKKKLVFLQSLNLSKIVACSLNPLRVCVSSVVDNFASITRDHQLVYCYTILENNSRSFLEKPVPEAFFPYDPYLLKRSSQYITPLYREYATEQETAEEEAAAAEESCVDQSSTQNVTMEDDDEFIKEHPTREKSHHFNFSYSTSPGFKQMSV